MSDEERNEPLPATQETLWALAQTLEADEYIDIRLNEKRQVVMVKEKKDAPWVG